MRQRIFNILQIILGLFMVIIGLNKFLVFTEIPNPPGDGGDLMQIYIKSGFLKLVGFLEILGGVGLLLRKFVPIALTIITAIMFNATVFHLLHDPMGIGPAAFCLLLCLVLVYAYKERLAKFLSS
ncbi:MAG: DoxX family protein [Bacteroidota bacterium]